MKIVLDTNCLVRILPKNSPYYCLWESFRQEKFILCYTTDMLQEYEELLLRFYSSNFVRLTMELLLKSPNIIQTIPYYKWNLIIIVDRDDNKFVDCAINAGADYIVTNDRHFNILKSINFPKINILDIDNFKKVISYSR